MFGISVSGIHGAQKHLDVTSNNIANANTNGFKKSRTEFADVYSNSIYSNNRIASGMGVNTSVVAQQFGQGMLSGDTGNALDMAIQGNGFFVVSQNEGSNSLSYTRNGSFHVNNEGFIVTGQDDYLMGWDVNEDGSSTTLDLNSTHPIQIPSDTGAPSASHNIGIGVNLPANKDPMKPGSIPANDPFTGQPWNPALTDEQKIEMGKYGYEREVEGAGKFTQYFSSFDPKNSDTYTCSTSQTIHDSLGNAHTVTYYMIKQGGLKDDETTSVWNVIPFVDGQPVDIAPNNGENPVMISVSDPKSSVNGANFFGFQMRFGSDGELVKGADGSNAGIIPAGIQLVNPNVTGSLRDILFGEPGEAENSGALEVNDPTFEVPKPGDPAPGKPVFDRGDGSLHKAIGVGVDPGQLVTIDFTKSTQYGSSTFNVSTAPWNDGYSTGLLVGVSVDKRGVIQCEYSNGRLINIGKVALADFQNTQGLNKIGDTKWTESIASGPAVAKEAGTGSAGDIIGANLEMSNVDLTGELVNLITAQRNYQANSQALQTQNTVMDAILNIR